jgi:hypothetical protein
MSPLTQVFLSGLASRYDSERQQVAGLSAMARAATCADLQQLLLTHHKLAKFRCNPEALDGTVPTPTSSDRFGHEIAMPEALGPGGSYSGRCKVIWHARWDDR